MLIDSVHHIDSDSLSSNCIDNDAILCPVSDKKCFRRRLTIVDSYMMQPFIGKLLGRSEHRRLFGATSFRTIK